MPRGPAKPRRPWPDMRQRLLEANEPGRERIRVQDHEDTHAIVFGKPGVIGQPFGGMFRVPAGGESPMHTHTSDYWAAMVSGTESAREKVADVPMKVLPGSTWYQPAKAPHVNKCMGPEECVFFVYYPNGMDYIPTNTTK